MVVPATRSLAHRVTSWSRWLHVYATVYNYITSVLVVIITHLFAWYTIYFCHHGFQGNGDILDICPKENYQHFLKFCCAVFLLSTLEAVVPGNAWLVAGEHGDICLYTRKCLMAENMSHFSFGHLFELTHFKSSVLFLIIWRAIVMNKSHTLMSYANNLQSLRFLVFF